MKLNLSARSGVNSLISQSTHFMDVLMKQIDEKGYLLPYTVDGRRLVKVGVSFDAGKRNLGDWLIV